MTMEQAETVDIIRKQLALRYIGSFARRKADYW